MQKTLLNVIIKNDFQHFKKNIKKNTILYDKIKNVNFACNIIYYLYFTWQHKWQTTQQFLILKNNNYNNNNYLQ